MPYPLRQLTPELSPRHELGALLRHARQRLNWSQRELADRVGSSPSMVSRIEKAERVAQMDFLQRCDVVLGTGGNLARIGSTMTVATRSNAQLGDVGILYWIGELTVRVDTNNALLISHLDRLYPRALRETIRSWRFDVRLGSSLHAGQNDSQGITRQRDEVKRILRLRASRPSALLPAVQRELRRLSLREWSRFGFVLLHAAAIHRDGLLIVFVGGRAAGKTTLALRGVLDHGFELIADDRLVVYRSSHCVSVTTLPHDAPVQLRSSRQDRYRADACPAPGRTVAVTSAAGRTPLAFRLGRETRVVMSIVEFDDHRNAFTLPEPLLDPFAAISAHLCVPQRMCRHDHDESSPPRPGSKGQTDALISSLLARAESNHWRHRGDIAPLLSVVRPGTRTAPASSPGAVARGLLPASDSCVPAHRRGDFA